MDATCCPADVAFPQDFRLLNDAREHLEHMVDDLCTENKLKCPRMHRKCTRRDYLNLSKSKKCSAKKIRTGVRKQLQYIIRDIGFIANMIRNNGVRLSKKQANLLNSITILYVQQLNMYKNRTHSFIPIRIEKPAHESLLMTLRPKQQVPQFAEKPTSVRSYIEALHSQMHEDYFLENKIYTIARNPLRPKAL